ncbi:MAG: hypothetical protein Aurels2KO_40800 [Aureliella sp.]
MSYTIVGVTGHIDHGKTSLVETLTGKNTDTHPEEKRRGITIDLGFATFSDGDDVFALIDAPGHQRYVGNLLSGVSRVDIGLLLVAADQGIQAQTIEHASILHALGVRALVVAISRCDLTSAEAQAELREEIEFFLTDTGFSSFPVVMLSSKTGQGIEQLREILKEHANKPSRAEQDTAGEHDTAGETTVRDIEKQVTRLPVDRAFRVEGRGWVAAGTLWRGQVAVGDTLQLVRTGRELRVREIEQHGEIRTTALPARRTAVNLAGDVDSLERGDELITPGSMRASNYIAIELYMFADAAELKLPVEVQLHTATTACTAQVLSSRDRSRRELVAGRRQVVLVKTSQPVVTVCDQPVLLRRPYPVGSFSGGRVIADMQILNDFRFPRESIPRKGQLLGRCERSDESFACDLAAAGSTPERLRCWIEQLCELETSPSSPVVKSLASFYQLESAGVSTELTKAIEGVKTAYADKGLAVAPEFTERVMAWQLRYLETSQRLSDSLWQPRAAVLRACDGFCSDHVANEALKRLTSSGQAVAVSNLVAVASNETKLSKKQTKNLAHMIQLLEASHAPPTTKELASQLATSVDQVEALARFAVHQQTLVDVGGGILYAKTQFDLLVRKLIEFVGEGTATVSEIREALELTRKHAVPLLEYCDKVLITLRNGNDRSFGPAAAEYRAEPTDPTTESA